MPQVDPNEFDKQDPLKILAYQYDLVCNGFEISSGAIRNHLPILMYKVFSKAGYSKEEVIGRCFSDFVAPESLDTFVQNFPRFKDVGKTRATEFEMIKKDGPNSAPKKR